MADTLCIPARAPGDDPCLTCGACCASFRVDFAVYELDSMGGAVPERLAMEVKGNTWRMRGTDRVPIRCEALTGRVGERVACSIYALRPAPCRAFDAGSDACQRARGRHGLPALPDNPAASAGLRGSHPYP